MTTNISYRISVGILSALARLPLEVLYVFSDIAYFIIYYAVRYRRKTVRHNLELVFGPSGHSNIIRIEKKFYRHLCDCIAETVKLLHISDEEIDRRAVVTNGEYIDDIIRSGHSVVLLLGHYGNWEWVQAIIHHFKEPLVGGQIYRPLRNKMMDMVMLRIRSRFGLECIPQKNAVRRLLGIERGGQKFVIGFISDQRPTGKTLHHWTTFLGQDTPYVVGGETIGNHVDARFVYLDMEKTSRGHYRLTFCPVVPDPEDKGPDPYTREFMKMLEKTIRREPAYWLWSHRRWKRHREQPL
ncbi:MAG: lysophospholipid acyltransferase family protein [Bacteroidetes bacterium]|uniref:Lysophospholipid acyltransferase family protein n=1 Tax=Candidatus Cryptobacteroides faecipullorum TaxID=2840764 RepID=A0A9D9I861_9BACT|nr:lysophospholipid acyltransferase family protein [Candidatus Cryptobacteroides faecipullorum]